MVSNLEKAKQWLEQYPIGRDTFINVINNLRINETYELLYRGELLHFTRQDWMQNIPNVRDFYRQITSQDEVESEIINSHRNILYLDLETCDLSAGFSPILMMAYRWNDGETKLVSLKDFPEDLANLPPEKVDYSLVKFISELVNSADVLCAHFGEKFDIPFIQTRCLVHRLPIIDNKKTKIFDPWRIAKYQLRCGRRLKALAKQLGCENNKDEVELIYWQRSKCIGNNKYFLEALDILGEYCKQDVNTLCDIAQLLLPLAQHLPNAQLMVGDNVRRCPICGGTELVQKGFTYAKANKYERYQCKSCGKFMRGSKNLSEISIENRIMY